MVITTQNFNVIVHSIRRNIVHDFYSKCVTIFCVLFSSFTYNNNNGKENNCHSNNRNNPPLLHEEFDHFISPAWNIEEIRMM